MKKLLILFLSFMSVQLVLAQQPAQDKARLERERQEIQREIQEIQSNYNKVRGLKKESLAKLGILQRKLELQDRLIGNINREIRAINDDIYLSTLEMNKLQTQLDTLKAQYARSVVYAYKNRSSYDFLNFIFSSNNFNDALKRVTYLKAYRSYRQQQVANILETKKIMENRKQQLLGKQSQKRSALQNKQLELSELANQKKEKDAVVAKLKSEEKNLSKEIASKKKRDGQLKNQIAAIVRREIEAARKEAAERAAAEKKANANAAAAAATPSNTEARPNTPAKPAAATKPKSYLDLNAKDVALNSSFEKNRGSLPWPVDNGVVSIPFGASRVEGLTIDNPGITISTPSAGGSVKAIFDGEVSAVSNLGDGMMVMIRHGKYFTVYSNLASASVSKGTVVKTGQVIGRTAQADDGSGGQLDLILMNETKNVNPAPWLRK
ncbi:MAG TPA: peptidoglycan DD-metalloendopeptidase family protein [Flavisolibacter sp.]|nr:peptidoglycan DD-metalloendopeptidase family protein [Flavisolibacter sp.]